MLNIECENKLAVKKRSILVYCGIPLSYNTAFQSECDYY